MKDNGEKRPMTEVEMRSRAREATAKAVDKWRSEGLSDADIEMKMGRPLPPELRR